MNDTIYTYEYRLWPRDRTEEKWLPKTRETFDSSFAYIMIDMTESEFNNMREQLFRLGFTIHETQRRVYMDPEVVL